MEIDKISRTEKVIRVRKSTLWVALVIIASLGFLTLAQNHSYYYRNQFIDFVVPLALILSSVWFVLGLASYISADPRAPEAGRGRGRKRMTAGVIAAVLVIIVWFAGQFMRPLNVMMESSNIGPSGIPSMESPTQIRPHDRKVVPLYPDNSLPTIEDTREFLKMSYSAEIKTRDVPTVVRNVKGVISENGGRVDNFSSSEKYASISFVVPQSKFESFRQTIESLTHAKLYTESISGENRLSQKQSIEERTNNTVETLASLNADRDALVSTHKQKLTVLENVRTLAKGNLDTVRAITADTTNETQLTTLRVQETEYLKQLAVAENSIKTENLLYNTEYNRLSTKISAYESDLGNLGEEDIAFTDNIETVNGYLNVNHVSYWQLAKIYSPFHPAWIIAILILIGWYLGRRSHMLPRIELI